MVESSPPDFSQFIYTLTKNSQPVPEANGDMVQVGDLRRGMDLPEQKGMKGFDTPQLNHP